jgi:hypothetical protein
MNNRIYLSATMAGWLLRAEIGVAVAQQVGPAPAWDLDLQEVFRPRTVRTIVEQLSQAGRQDQRRRLRATTVAQRGS